MAHHLAVEDLIVGENLAKYEEFLRENPAETVAECVTWVAKNLRLELGRKSIWRHRQRFLVRLRAMKHAAEMARAMQDAGVCWEMTIETVKGEAVVRVAGSKWVGKEGLNRMRRVR